MHVYINGPSTTTDLKRNLTKNGAYATIVYRITKILVLSNVHCHLLADKNCAGTLQSFDIGLQLLQRRLVLLLATNLARRVQHDQVCELLILRVDVVPLRFQGVQQIVSLVLGKFLEALRSAFDFAHLLLYVPLDHLILAANLVLHLREIGRDLTEVLFLHVV